MKYNFGTSLPESWLIVDMNYLNDNKFKRNKKINHLFINFLARFHK